MHRALALLVTVVLLGALAPAASAKIVVGVGIAGVKLGDSATAVKRKLGTPQKVMRGRDGKVQVFNYTRRKIVLTVTKGYGVTELNTFNSHDRTSKGIHVGSLLTSVDKAYPGACDLEFSPHCAIARRVNGKQTTTQFDAGASRDTKHVGAVKVQWLLPIR